MAEVPGAARPEIMIIAELNRKVVDQRRTFTPAPSLAEKVIRAEGGRARYKAILQKIHA